MVATKRLAVSTNLSNVSPIKDYTVCHDCFALFARSLRENICIDSEEVVGRKLTDI